MSTLVQALGDSAVVARRNVIKNRRVPDVVVFATIAPISFVLLFAFVLGSAINVPGSSYKEFLIVGFLVQTILYSASNTGVGLAQDLQKGMVDRFRSLPMARSAVLVGRTTSDLVTNVLVLVIMTVTGLLIGWRIRSSWVDALAGFGLLLLFAYASSWLMAVVGLLVRSPEVLTNVMFMTIMPLTFISNAFVPSEGLPGPLRFIAEWNPVSAVVQASRELFGNTAGVPAGAAWPLQNSVLASLLWIAVLLIVFVPLAINQYKKAVSR